MSDEKSHEHHTSQPRAPIPLNLGPEAEITRFEQPALTDTEFVDRQFSMWCLPIHVDVVASILAETDADPAMRPGRSNSAKLWESRVADLANDASLDDEGLEDDPYEVSFQIAHARAEGDPRKSEAVKKLERLYKHRVANMTLKEQYEKKPPNTLGLVLGRIFPEVES